MPGLSFGTGISLGGRQRLSLGEGGGAYVATESSLRALYAANVGVDTPHTLAVMSSPPTIATGAGTASAPAAPYTALTNAYRYTNGSTALAYLGGGDAVTGTTYRRFPVATKFTSGGNVTTTEDATYFRVKAVIDAAAVAFRVLGVASTTVGYRFIVDGQYVSLSPTVVATGGRQYIVLDFGSKAARTIIVESALSNGFDGIHVAVGDTVSYPALEPRIALFLGDSFTRGTGTQATGDAAGLAGDGYYTVLAEQLGFENIWASGLGGTGFVADNTGASYTLGQRLVADIARAKSFGTVAKVFVAMGLNDLGLSGIQAAASADFDTIRAQLPAASVSVLCPWDSAAPGAPSSAFNTAKAAIQAAMAGRGGFHFLDIEGTSYTKYDATHPDSAGHATLGNALLTLERAALAA